MSSLNGNKMSNGNGNGNKMSNGNGNKMNNLNGNKMPRNNKKTGNNMPENKNNTGNNNSIGLASMGWNKNVSNQYGLTNEEKNQVSKELKGINIIQEIEKRLNKLEKKVNQSGGDGDMPRNNLIINTVINKTVNKNLQRENILKKVEEYIDIDRLKINKNELIELTNKEKTTDKEFLLYLLIRYLNETTIPNKRVEKIINILQDKTVDELKEELDMMLYGIQSKQITFIGGSKKKKPKKKTSPKKKKTKTSKKA